MICRQGEAAHSFFLVRIGFIKVTESHPGGDLILAYIGRAGFLGELSLLGAGAYTATCTALDHVEAVRIRPKISMLMIEQFPDVNTPCRPWRRNASRRIAPAHTIRSAPIDSFLAQGLMDAQSLLVLDFERCTRCDQCVRACADAHDGVSRLIRDGLRLDNYLIATSCRQCKDPLCMVGCPVGSIRRKNSLEIVIEDWCIGCGLCASNCPYGNINMHPFQVQVDDLLSLAERSRRCKPKPPLAISAWTMTSPAAFTHARMTRPIGSILVSSLPTWQSRLAKEDVSRDHRPESSRLVYGPWSRWGWLACSMSRMRSPRSRVPAGAVRLA